MPREPLKTILQGPGIDPMKEDKKNLVTGGPGLEIAQGIVAQDPLVADRDRDLHHL